MEDYFQFASLWVLCIILSSLGEFCSSKHITAESSVSPKSMKESFGISHLCFAMKSFSVKVRGMLYHCKSRNKYNKLDTKLEKKMIEAMKQRGESGQRNFRSINSIILRFPQFKEGLKNIRVVFEQFDEDSNGTIDYKEFKKCLDKLQLRLTEKEMDDLFHSCDVDGNEGIQYNEFIVLLCLIYLLMEPSTLHSSVSTGNLTSKMGSPELEATFNTMVEAFLFLDKNGDGKLNKNDVIKALNEGTPWERSPRHVTKTRFKEMDWTKSGKVRFREFLFALIDWVGIDTDEEDKSP